MVKAVILVFYSIQSHFIRDIHAKMVSTTCPESPDIEKNSDGGISDFLISGQFLIKENCHNSRTGDDIDMKLRPVIKLQKQNKTMSKKIDDDVMSENYGIILISKLDSGWIVCKTHVFVNNNFLSYLLSYKNWKKTLKKSLTQLSHYCFE